MSNAGSVNVVLSMNAATFSAGIKQAQAQLDQFSGKAKQAGEHTVSGMQAASASIRLLENPLGNNTRAIERLISQSQLLSGVMKLAFPVVGAVAMGMVVGKLVEDVTKFIKTVQEMPKSITNGFAALNLAGQTSVDQLRLTNDELQNTIDKLQGKPQNNTKIALDETKLSADKLAESILSANTKINELLSKDHLSGWALLMGKRGTADREGTVKYYGQQQDDAALRVQQAVGSGDKNAEAKARADLKSSQDSEYKNMILDINSQKEGQKAGAGDGSANIAIDTGVATSILTQQNQQKEQERNAALVPQEKAAQEAKAAQEKAKAAALKAAEAYRRGLDDQLEVNRAYERLSEDMAKATSEHNQEVFKSNGLSGDDQKSLDDAGKASLARITAMQQSIALSKENADAMAMASLQMSVATGQMTRLDAAQVVSTMHTQDYLKVLAQLKTQRDAIANDPTYNNHPEARQAALQDNQNRMDSVNGARSIQVAQDNQNTNPGSSSALVGATDALDEFTQASRDSAAQMKNFTTNALNGFNDAIVKIISTPHQTGLQTRQQLGNYGAGLARSVAGTGLQKAEGSVLGAFGLGGKPDGSKDKPLYVRMANDPGSPSSSPSGFLGKIFNGGGNQSSGSSGSQNGVTSSASSGITGFLKSLFGGKSSSGTAGVNSQGDGSDDFSDFSDDDGDIPFLASGGPINGPAIVGENGPELFNPGTSGTIIPNHKLSSALGNGGGHTIMIDASGSTDPAQTRVQVMRGIQAAAPHISAATISTQKQDSRRTPPSRRKS